MQRTMGSRSRHVVLAAIAATVLCCGPWIVAQPAQSAPQMRLSSLSSEHYAGQKTTLKLEYAPRSGTLTLQVNSAGRWTTVRSVRASTSILTYFRDVPLPSGERLAAYRVVAGARSSNVLSLTVHQPASTFWMNQTNLEAGRLYYSVVADNGATMSSQVTYPFRSRYFLNSARGNVALLSQDVGGNTAYYRYTPGQQPQYWVTIQGAPWDAGFGRTADEMLVLDYTFQPGSSFRDLYAVNAQGRRTQLLARFPGGSSQSYGVVPWLDDFAVNPKTGDVYLSIRFSTAPDRYYIGRIDPNAPPVDTSKTSLQLLQDQSWISQYAIVHVANGESVDDIQFSPSGKFFGYRQHYNPIDSGGSVCRAPVLSTTAFGSASCVRLNTGNYVYDFSLRTDTSGYYAYRDGQGLYLVGEVDMADRVDWGLAGRALSTVAG